MSRSYTIWMQLESQDMATGEVLDIGLPEPLFITAYSNHAIALMRNLLSRYNPTVLETSDLKLLHDSSAPSFAPSISSQHQRSARRSSTKPNADAPPSTTVESGGRSTQNAPPDLEEPARIQAIDDARSQYADDECEIDDDAKVSVDDEGGVWVQSWVYLDPPEPEEHD